MKKTMMMMLTLCYVLFVYGQSAPTPKLVEVTNYKEVISEAQYPTSCKEEGIEGKVIVSLSIDEHGKLVDHEFKVYPSEDIKLSVEKILPLLKFNPAINQHGQTVAGKVIIPINFKLTI